MPSSSPAPFCEVKPLALVLKSIACKSVHQAVVKDIGKAFPILPG